MKIKSFKLINGDEIVARLNGMGEQTGGVLTYKVESPRILQFQPVSPGQLGLAFVPWTLSNPQIADIEIPASLVGVVFDPSPEVEKQYMSQTSRIQLMG